MTSVNGQWGRLALVSTAALALAACESSGSYRVASVGSVSAVPDDPADTGTGGGNNGTGNGSGGSGGSGTGSGGTGGSAGMSGPLLVTSGNAVIGVAGTTANVAANLGIPGSGIVDAVVTGVIRRTGQTLVQLGGGNGGTLILGGTGGRIGDVLSLDLGAGKVIGGPSGSPLIGLNVLAQNPSTGRLATVNAASAGKLVSVAVPGLTGAGGGNGRGLLPGLVPVPQANAGATAGANAGVAGTVTSTVNGVVSPSSGVGVGSVTNVVTQPLQGVLGVTGVVKPKTPK